MGDGGGRTALTPRLAWAIPATFLCLLLPARGGVAADYGNGAAGAAAAVALFALPLLYTVPRGRVVWDRHKWWLLAAQAVVTYLPFAMFGRGMANLSARAAALGGGLTTRSGGGRFELTVRVPAGASVRPRGEDALAAGDPAHGVDEVVGGTVLDQEP